MKINLKAYFNLLRVKEWRGFFLIALFGFFVAKGFLFPLKEIILFFAMILLLLAFGFSINDCFDTKEDKYKEEIKNPIVRKEMSFKESFLLALLSGVLGLTLSVILGFKVFLLCLAAVLTCFFYSAPPFRLKSRPVVDLISHGLFAGAFIFLLPLVAFQEKLSLIYYLMAFSVFYLSVTLELRNHLEDYKTDKEAGLKTTVCVLGYEKSERLLRYLAIFYPLILTPLFFLFLNQYFFLFFIFSLIFLFLFLLSKNYQLIKNYRLMDAYTIFSFCLVSAAIILG